MVSPAFEHALQEYEEALTVLTETAASNLSPQQVLEVILTREQLARLQRYEEYNSSELWARVILLDQQFQDQKEKIAEVKDCDIGVWRKSITDRTRGWWWFLPSPVDPKDRWDWVWSGLSVAAFTTAIGLLLNISSRLFTGGVDVGGAIAVGIQSSIALITAKNAFTDSGKTGLGYLFDHLKLKQSFRQEARFLLSLLFLGLIGTMYLLLPNSSGYYRWLGRKDMEAIPPNFATGETNYKRALALNPDDAEAQFQLGSLYENLQDTESARKAYRAAVQGGDLRAANNLARLHILAKNYDAALYFLRLVEKRSNQENSELMYYLRKNLGWVHFEQKRFLVAKINLEQAINILEQNPQSGEWQNKASAYCLTAQVLQRLNPPKSSYSKDEQIAWNECLTKNFGETPEEAKWYAIAQEKLFK